MIVGLFSHIHDSRNFFLMKYNFEIMFVESEISLESTNRTIIKFHLAEVNHFIKVFMYSVL